MMNGKQWSLLADALRTVKPRSDESLAAWIQFNECTEAIASACKTDNPERFSAGRFRNAVFKHRGEGDAHTTKGDIVNGSIDRKPRYSS